MKPYIIALLGVWMTHWTGYYWINGKQRDLSWIFIISGIIIILTSIFKASYI